MWCPVLKLFSHTFVTDDIIEASTMIPTSETYDETDDIEDEITTEQIITEAPYDVVPGMISIIVNRLSEMVYSEIPDENEDNDLQQ